VLERDGGGRRGGWTGGGEACLKELDAEQAHDENQEDEEVDDVADVADAGAEGGEEVLDHQAALGEGPHHAHDADHLEVARARQHRDDVDELRPARAPVCARVCARVRTREDAHTRARKCGRARLCVCSCGDARAKRARASRLLTVIVAIMRMKAACQYNRVTIMRMKAASRAFQ
jgi:hypothetical protein